MPNYELLLRSEELPRR